MVVEFLEKYQPALCFLHIYILQFDANAAAYVAGKYSFEKQLDIALLEMLNS